MGVNGVVAAAILLVRVYDGHHVSADDLQMAQAQAGAILRDAGIDARWIQCDRDEEADIGVPPQCGRPLGPRDVVLRIRPAGSAPGTHSVSMGSSLVGEGALGTPVFSTVYADRVSVVAQGAGVDRGLLLGRAVAHEIGHLLLNTSHHAERGLMRAMWSARELRRNTDADWKFLESEAGTMVAALAARGGEAASW